MSPGRRRHCPNRFGTKDFGHSHWLDTGGRYRGFVVLRWLDNPQPPAVRTTVCRGQVAS